ncbi:MAG: NAD(P)/FAD-dependent oxidoreductase [Gemmatimonadetes bacterium]|nr:NAD(P)/FAD-dependent oxidoreductase [Gemmatimonadota bacterium]
MTATYDAVVIGAGHNGLVTAAYLAKAGLRVLVLERREAVGGAAVTEELAPGFRCDTGAHRIGLLRREIARDLALTRYGLEIVRPDPAVFTPLPDGRHLVVWREPRKTAEAIRGFSKADAERWIPFTTRMAKVARVLAAVQAIPPPRVTEPARSDLWTFLKLGARLRLGGRTAMADLLRTLPMSAADLLDEWFESDALKGTLGAGGITGVFQGPRSAGTAYVMLHYAGSEPGALRPCALVRGGTGKLAQALAGAAVRHGAQIRTGAEVRQILVRDGCASGVLLASGEEIAAARVISNADPRRTFLGLVDPVHLGAGFLQEIRHMRFGGACAKVHLALGELPNFTCAPGDGPHLRGVISIAPSLDYLERAYDDAKYGGISCRPYLEAVIPSLHDSGLAPPGRHVMSILVQYAPYRLKEGGWDAARRDALADLVVETLAEYAPNVKSAIIARHVLTPCDLEAVFGLTEGNIHHGEMTLDQLFFMRPVPGWARYRTPIERLYLCGAGAHPGGGVSGMSGWNAAREILSDVRSDSRG